MNIAAGLVIIALAVINLIDMKKYEEMKRKKKQADSDKNFYANRLMRLNYKINKAEKEGKESMPLSEIKRTINSDQTI